MKIQISIKNLAIFSLIALLAASCAPKKDTPTPVVTPTVYTNLNDFLVANAVKSEIHTFNASAGVNFTTAKGTKVTIKPNIFVDASNNPATGTITVEFKDIYKKSDMLFSQMPVMLGNGAPLKSAGEFFIKVTKDSTALNLVHNKSITIEQPAVAGAVDKAMKPFVFGKGTAGGNGWQPSFGDSTNAADSLYGFAASYIFTLYKFSVPATGGTWCNSDNSSYFSTYTNTVLTIIPDFSDTAYHVNVFLVFKGINSMVHVYDVNAQFPYNYAPIGLSCTVVALGVKGNKLYSSYTDVTISANQTVHIPISETTEADIKTKLVALDN